MPNNGYWAHLHPRFDSGCSFRFYKNSKLFLEFFYTFTHEQIHLYKIIRNELFFFLFQAIDNFILILAQLYRYRKNNYWLDRICLSHDCDSTKMNLQFFFNIEYLHLRKRNVIRRFLFSFFNRHTKIKRG